MRRVLTGLAGVLVLMAITVSSYAQTGIATGSLYESELINFGTFEENMNTVVELNDTIHSEVADEHPELNLTNYGYHEVEIEPKDWHLSNWNGDSWHGHWLNRLLPCSRSMMTVLI